MTFRSLFIPAVLAVLASLGHPVVANDPPEGEAPGVAVVGPTDEKPAETRGAEGKAGATTSGDIIVRVRQARGTEGKAGATTSESRLAVGTMTSTIPVDGKTATVTFHQSTETGPDGKPKVTTSMTVDGNLSPEQKEQIRQRISTILDRKGDATSGLAVVPRFTADKMILEFVNQVHSDKPEIATIRAAGPVIVMERLDELPDDMSISFTRKGKEPGTLTVTQGEQKWEGTPDELSKMPPIVQVRVRSVLHKLLVFPGGAFSPQPVFPPVNPYLSMNPYSVTPMYEGAAGAPTATMPTQVQSPPAFSGGMPVLVPPQYGNLITNNTLESGRMPVASPPQGFVPVPPEAQKKLREAQQHAAATRERGQTALVEAQIKAMQAQQQVMLKQQEALLKQLQTLEERLKAAPTMEGTAAPAKP